MPKRSSKDVNQLAKSIVDQATEESPPEDQAGQSDDQPEKDPAAVELGRRGGKKGGKARAEKLSADERREIARKAARARWARKNDLGEPTD